jgi:hypothetical protein
LRVVVALGYVVVDVDALDVVNVNTPDVACRHQRDHGVYRLLHGVCKGRFFELVGVKLVNGIASC